jgi:uncharacterized protein YndB with AHSA1/START domain
VITFQTGVRIERPIEEVFAFVSDPLNIPSWNSAVETLRRSDVDSTYSMERRLPVGHAVNELEIVALERPVEVAVRTTSGPTPFHYRYRLSEENGTTAVQLDAAVELGRVPALFAPLAARAVKRGVDDNFAALKKILERRS